jgi:hypothetical protein
MTAACSPSQASTARSMPDGLVDLVRIGVPLRERDAERTWCRSARWAKRATAAIYGLPEIVMPCSAPA